MTDNKEEKVNKLVELLKSPNSKQFSLQEIGDLCREENERIEFGKNTELFSELTALLNSTEESEILQLALRVVGNLSFQNEENRNKFVELNITNTLIQLFKKYTEHVNEDTLQPLLRNLCGCLANVTFISDDVLEKLDENDILSNLFEIVSKSSNSAVISMSLRAITNLTENEIIKEKIASIENKNQNFFELLITKFWEFDESHNEVISLFLALIEGSEFNSLNFLKSGGLSVLYKFVIELDEDDEDEESQNEAWKLFTILASFEKLNEYFWNERIVHRFISFLQNKNLVSTKLSQILVILGHLAVNQECMNYLFENCDLLCNYLRNDDKQLKMGAAIVIGNIARTDENCVKLAEKEGVVSTLLSLLETDENPQVHHLCLGALRNMAIPISNKSLLFNHGIFGIIDNLINKSNNAHVLFNSILTLKIVLNLKDQTIANDFSEKCLKTIIEIFKRDLFEEQMRIHFEAARLLLILSSTDEKLRNKVLDDGGIVGLKLLLKSPFALLQNEILDFFTVIVDNIDYSHIFDEEIISLISLLITSEDSDVRSKSFSILRRLSSFESKKSIISAIEELPSKLKEVKEKNYSENEDDYNTLVALFENLQ